MARKKAEKIDIDVLPFTSIMMIVAGVVSLILFLVGLRIAMNPKALRVVSLPGLMGSQNVGESLKVPFYIDVAPDGMTIYPGEITVSVAEFQMPGNEVEKLLDRIEKNHEEEYVVVLARPGSVRLFRSLRNQIAKRRMDVGYEFMDADFKVNWNEAVQALNIAED
jgi:biopolymer transport protein ExbD